jgi:predicted transport protein
MSDIKLFRLTSSTATEMQGVASDLEKPLQTLIESNLQELLGVRFLKSEYSTGKTHKGRIDTLGLDENNSPVIFEYKRSSSESVINQGLYYLNWLMDHKAEFEQIVSKTLNRASAEAIDWSAPRVICIASDFSKFDEHAVEEMGRNIELFRYKKFGNEFLLLELVNSVTGKPSVKSKPTSYADTAKSTTKSATVYGAAALAQAKAETRELFASLEGYIMSLGDDVQRKDLKLYIAFKRIRNFTTVEVYKDKLLLHLHLNPDNVDLVEDFTRDVRSIGHWGTGDLEVWVRSNVDLERVKPLIKQAHQGGLSTG